MWLQWQLIALHVIQKMHLSTIIQVNVQIAIITMVGVLWYLITLVSVIACLVILLTYLRNTLPGSVQPATQQ
jgi:hypothetical protein